LADSRAALRREQVRILLVAVPVLLATYLLLAQLGSLSDARLIAVVALLPLAAVLGALGLPLVRERRLVLGGGFLWFFVVYCVFFSLAAGSRVLEGKRTVVLGFTGDTPSNVLGLNRLGDWHYAVAPRAPYKHDLLVITLPSFEGLPVDSARRAEIGIIRMAIDHGAKGIAFDYDMSDTSSLDRAVCFWIQKAESDSVPVVLGYVLELVNGSPTMKPPAPPIAGCKGVRLGTLGGVRESDGFVRMVPTSDQGHEAQRSFSYRIAQLLAPGKLLPDVGLAQFVGPEDSIPVLVGMPNEATARLMRGQFVIVGSDRPDDVHLTPYGKLPGVLIHAYAANALRTGSVIRRLDVRWVLPVILVLCYLLVLLQSYGGLRPLLIGATLIALAVVLSAAFAMKLRLVWVDVSYPLLAIAGLTAVLAGGARLKWERVWAPKDVVSAAAATAGSAGVSVETFDVFLSHNSADKPTVIELATILRDDRKLRVWLDAWELVPGRAWQPALEQVIATVGSAAVLVGKDGLGPWEEPEMRACLDQCVRRKMPVIPVLLPGASASTELPLFLRQFTWVDLRDGLDDKRVDRLEWGITGIKPRRV
jgi:hypothetical protein